MSAPRGPHRLEAVLATRPMRVNPAPSGYSPDFELRPCRLRCPTRRETTHPQHLFHPAFLITTMTDPTIHRAAAGLPVIPATPFSHSSTHPTTTCTSPPASIGPIRHAGLGDDRVPWSRWLSRWRDLGLEDDLDAAVGLVPEDLVSVRGLFQRQVVGGEGLHAERVAAVGHHGHEVVDPALDVGLAHAHLDSAVEHLH